MKAALGRFYTYWYSNLGYRVLSYLYVPIFLFSSLAFAIEDIDVEQQNINAVDKTNTVWSAVCPRRYDADIVGSCYQDVNMPVYCEYHVLNALSNTVHSPNDRTISEAKSYPLNTPQQQVTNVIYTDFTGDVIADKTIDYSMSDIKPATRQRDLRFGEIRLAQPSADNEEQWDVGYKASFKRSYKRKLIKEKKIKVNDAGFDNFVRKNWSTLVSGGAITFDFLSIPHKRTVELTARKLSVERCASTMRVQVDDSQTLCIGVSVRNMIFKLFASSLILSYDKDTQQLQQFSGAVNIVDNNNKTQNCALNYRYF